MERTSNLISSHHRVGLTVVFMLLASMGCFIAGIILPFTAVTKLWLFENQISVCRGLVVLWKADEIFLFLILLVFTVCFPFVKINALLALWLYPGLTARTSAELFQIRLASGQMVHAGRLRRSHPRSDNQIQWRC